MTLTIPLWLAWTLLIVFTALGILFLFTVAMLAVMGAAFWSAIDRALRRLD